MPDRPPRILLVDDEQPIQTLLSFPLQRDGYEVVQASDGREALARFSEQTFDLVVLDVMLPKMDGLEVCRRLRARSESKVAGAIWGSGGSGLPSSENIITTNATSAGSQAIL